MDTTGRREHKRSLYNGSMVRHHYISTACQHEFHTTCPLNCQYCATKCRCSCHAAPALRAVEVKSAG